MRTKENIKRRKRVIFYETYNHYKGDRHFLERTRVEWVSAAEGAKFAKTMNEFAETITKLGENRRLEDLRCKE